MSSVEAEYLALSKAWRVIAWLHQVLGELKIEQSPTAVFQDNNGGIDWAQEGPAKN